MTNQDLIKIYKQAIKTYGKKAQKLMAIEEMSELTKEICKDFRQRNNRECILDEITDVSIMLEQLIMIYDFKPNELSKQKQMKLLRLQRTIETIKDFSRS